MNPDNTLPQQNRPGRRRRGFDRDDRAITPLLGAILLFALLLALLVLIQVTAVPGWNQQVEYDHNQRVQEDMRGFEAGVAQAGQLDRSSSAVVENGVEYPSRPFLFNPPDPAGTTETTETGAVNITNANITGVDTVWRNRKSNYTTQWFQYVPDYNEYANSPVTRFENGILYNDYGGTVVPLTETNLVDGREITIVTLDGRVSTTRGGASTVSLEPLAGESRPVSIQSHNGSDIVLTFPTQLDEDTWETILADERSGGGNVDGYITDLSVIDNPGEPYDTLRLELRGTVSGTPSGERIQYRLRMGKVGLDGTGERERAHYLALDSPRNVTVDEGTTTTVTVQVRNRYNNPVQGQSVTFNLTSGGASFVGESAREVAITTGADGRASIQVRADDGASTVRIEEDLDGSNTVDPRETVAVGIDGQDTSGGTDPTENDDSINPAGTRDVVLIDSEAIGSSTGGGGNKIQGVNMTFENRDTEPREIELVRVNFFFSPQSSKDNPTGNITFQGADQPLTVGGPFVDFTNDPGVTPDELEMPLSKPELLTTFRFEDEVNQEFLMAVTVVYENGRIATYIVDKN